MIFVLFHSHGNLSFSSIIVNSISRGLSSVSVYIHNSYSEVSSAHEPCMGQNLKVFCPSLRNISLFFKPSFPSHLTSVGALVSSILKTLLNLLCSSLFILTSSLDIFPSKLIKMMSSPLTENLLLTYFWKSFGFSPALSSVLFQNFCFPVLILLYLVLALLYLG